MSAVNELAKTHLSLHVSDLEQSVRFYEAFFGVPAHKRRPGYANFDLAEPPLKLALNQNETPVRAGAGTLSHLGVQMPTQAQVEAARQRLIASGIASFDEGDTTCCYAVQNKIWAHDPDGNGWEVYFLTDDLLDDHDHDHRGNPLPLASAASCCGSREETCCA